MFFRDTWMLRDTSHSFKNSLAHFHKLCYIFWLFSFFFFAVAQQLSHVWLCDPMDCRTPGFPVLHYFPEFAHIHVHWVGDANHLILCCLLILPSIFPSIKVFFSELALPSRWPKYWSFRFNISPSNEYSVLISSRMDWFDIFAVQGTLKSLLQHYNSKVLILWHSAFFMVQLSHLYMTTGKVIALIIQTFVGKVMSLLFNIMSRFVIAFLPRSIF